MANNAQRFQTQNGLDSNSTQLRPDRRLGSLPGCLCLLVSTRLILGPGGSRHDRDLSGEYEIDGAGLIPMPLVGSIRIQGMTVAEAKASIKTAYQPDYVKNPRISIQVLNYRPFYIMGQVGSPGSYPYVNGITVLEAVVIAGGFTKRAKESKMTIIRGIDATRKKQDATPESVILPGDVIEVPQRYF